MYTITKKNSNGILSSVIQNQLSGELIEILPSYGGNINKIELEKKGKVYSLLKTKRCENDFKGTSIFTGAKLSPYPNRIDQGKYNFEDQQYQLDINFQEENNACHGFIYDKEFEIREENLGDDYAEVKLGYNHQGESQGYPFNFDIELAYLLQNRKGLVCTTKVVNKDYKDLPLGDGWHPLVQLNNCVEELALKFHSEKLIEVNEKLIPTGKTKFYNEFITSKKINDTTFDDCFRLQINGNIHFTEIYSELENLKVVLWQEVGQNKYNYLQLYIPPERDSIAIEPMTCYPNCFNHKEDLIILKPHEVFEAKFGINIG